MVKHVFSTNSKKETQMSTSGLHKKKNPSRQGVNGKV